MKIETTCSLTTVKELCEAFWKIEKELNLVEFEINSVKIWQHLRIQIYYKIAEHLGLFGRPHEFNAQKCKALRFFSLLKGSIIANPFLNFNKVDNIIFDHPRSKEVDGELIDIYTDGIIKKNIEQQVKFIVIERSFDSKHKRKKKDYISYMDFFVLIGEVKANFFKKRLTSWERNTISKIEENIFQNFSVSISLTEWFEFEANKFNIISKLLSIYFKIKSPECIYVLVSYALGYAIKAAKENGIKVIELQHGVISRYHMGYSYPGRSDNLDYFPDKLWTWGSYWNESSSFPLSKQDIIAQENHFFNVQKKKYLKFSKIKNTILVISQGVLGNKLVSYISDALPALGGNYQITFKLHPGEYDRYQSYSKIDNLLDSPDVQIVQDVDLYALFSVSEYQVGVFSTAIYEGLSFGCKTILLDLPGIEYMEHLLEKKMATICEHSSMLNHILCSMESCQPEISTGNYTRDYEIF